MASHEPYKNTIKVLEQSQVSPPPGSVPPTKLPLTFFDIPFLGWGPVQRLFFYNLPHPTQHITRTIIPDLKRALSLTLRHFFPLAATLRLPPPPQKPYLLYSNESSVQFTVAESSADFNALASNNERGLKESYRLVPKFSHVASQPSGEDPSYALPALALQVTIFPDFGLSIGASYNHVVADGKSIAHFMKSWATIFRSKNIDIILDQTPSHERDLIKDPRKFESALLESIYSPLWNSKRVVPLDTDLTPLDGIARATFSLGRAQIERLKAWVSDQFMSHDDTKVLHVSRFVVTCAFTWVHLVKSRLIDGDVICYFTFPADCRNHKIFEFPVPKEYFGNCLALSIVAVKRSELAGENGFFAATKAIATQIKELENGALREVVNRRSDIIKAVESGNITSIVSSPSLRVYETDFGWGRPKKCEIVHSNDKVIVLFESGDEEGGEEIGLTLYKNTMDNFVSSFKQGLNLLLK